MMKISNNKTNSNFIKNYLLPKKIKPLKSFLEDFNYEEIQILDSYLENLGKKDVDFLNSFNPDKLLYNFRLCAGFSDKEMQEFCFDNSPALSSYSGWENTRIGGHTLGHYLTASAQAIKNGFGKEKGPDNKTLEERLLYILKALTECQNNNNKLCKENPKRKEGFIFGATMKDFSDPEMQFNLMENKIYQDTWVPWYTMHKILTGLVETYKLIENPEAYKLAINLGEWIYNRCSAWTLEQRQNVLNVEYGGMNDCLYELYKIALENNYQSPHHFEIAAHLFDEEELFQSILESKYNSGNLEDILNNKHANCTIPKFLGALNRYKTLGDKKYLDYAIAFWNIVVNHHTYITGGNSECEHFGKDNILDLERSNCNCESCNSHNMLKLTRELLKITGNKAFADYYEQTYQNAIISSMNPETGTTAYFQPMATGCFKNFSNPDVEKNYFWCCTGTGLENFTKLNDSLYFHSENAVFINQFVSSKLIWKEKSLELTLKANLIESKKIQIQLDFINKSDSTLSIYIPLFQWLKKSPLIFINNEEFAAKQTENWLILEKNWNNTNIIELDLDFEVQAFNLPDNENAFAFQYGPYVLAADLGSDEEMTLHQVGVLCDVAGNKKVGNLSMILNGNYGGTSNLKTLETENIYIEDFSPRNFKNSISEILVQNKTEDSLPLSFSLKNPATKQELKFLPYNRIYKSRYGIYWLFNNKLSNKEEEILNQKLESRKNHVFIDGIGIGYGAQTEGNKNTFPCIEETGTGSTGNPEALTRFANKNGEFSYLFKIKPGIKNYLGLNFFKKDNGKSICIRSGKVFIYQGILNYTGQDEIYTQNFEIPLELIKKAEDFNNEKVIRISFSGLNMDESAALVSPAITFTEYSHNGQLKNLCCSNGKIEKISDTHYIITADTNLPKVKIKADLFDEFGLLYVNQNLVNDSDFFEIESGKTSLKIFGEDHETCCEILLELKN